MPDSMEHKNEDQLLERPDPSQAKEGLLDNDEGAAYDLAEHLLGVADDIVEGITSRGSQADRAITLALRQKGMKERGCASNRNPYSRYFGFGAQFWCADFVAWALDRTGNRDRKVPWGDPSLVANIIRWAEREDLVRTTPERGHIFCRRNASHTGLVSAASGGSFTTIEGNTSGPDGRSCWVYDHRRRNDGSYLFVRWPW